MATKDHFIIHGLEDYKLHYHMSPEGHIWLDAKNNTIPLNSQLVGHIELIDPNTYWQSRATWTNIHSSVTPPQRGGAVHSTAVTQQPPQHTSHTSPIQNEFEVLDNFWLGLVNLTRYHNCALLNVNLNWRKHLETQDCESLRQTILNIKTFTKLHKDTNNYLQEIIAYCDNFSKINIDSLSESEESLLSHKQKVFYNQLKELCSIFEKAENKFCELQKMLAVCLSAPTVLENGSQDEIFRLSQNLKWLHPTIYKVVVPVNNTIGCPSTELGSSSVSCD